MAWMKCSGIGLQCCLTITSPVSLLRDEVLAHSESSAATAASPHRLIADPTDIAVQYL